MTARRETVDDRPGCLPLLIVLGLGAVVWALALFALFGLLDVAAWIIERI